MNVTLLRVRSNIFAVEKQSYMYKDEMVFCSFLFVYLYLIQSHISEPISTKLCTRLPLRLEEVVAYVRTHNI